VSWAFADTGGHAERDSPNKADSARPLAEPRQGVETGGAVTPAAVNRRSVAMVLD
jgi:hypothetical protein